MAARRRIRLVHWKEEEVPERAARLEAEGFEVDGRVPGSSIGVKQLREDPPAGFVIDLGRLPSHGLEVARSLRDSKALRQTPIVFVDGAEEKVARVREQLPDAIYTAWDEIGADLGHALDNPISDPVVPASSSGPQSGRSLVQKLGVKAGTTVALLDAPEGFEEALSPPPDDVVLRQGNRGRREMTVWFITSARQLESRFDTVAKAVGEGMLWVAWPKRTSGVETDLTEDVIRQAALDRGMVDTKVCAIDETWSGLRLTLRRA
jgi:CheY-like chemotaxis protein